MNKPESTEFKPDDRWLYAGFEAQVYFGRVGWLAEPRGLPGRSLRYFEAVASILRLSQCDYALATVGFFHSIVGLEAVLRPTENGVSSVQDNALKQLLIQAEKRRVFASEPWTALPKFSAEFSGRCGVGQFTSADQVIDALVDLRNEYFHGRYRLASDYLPLTFMVRSMADCVAERCQEN